MRKEPPEMKFSVLFLLVVFLTGLPMVSPAVTSAYSDINPGKLPDEPCSLSEVCTRRGGTVRGEDIIRCAAEGRPVNLTNVIIRGNLDFRKLPAIQLNPMDCNPSPQKTYWCKTLDLPGLECQIGRQVAGIRGVVERFSISHSTISGEIISPTPGELAAEDFFPLTFLQDFVLRDSKVEGKTKLNFVQFSQDFNAKGTTFCGALSLNSAQFHGRANFSEANLNNNIIDLQYAIFHKMADFTSIKTVGDACDSEVSGDPLLNFSGAMIKGGIYFRGGEIPQSKRLCEVMFYGTTIDGPLIRWEDLEFQGSANFSNANFKKKAHFVGVRFKGHAGFNEVRFESGADFHGAMFENKADFVNARFGEFETVSFDFVKFLGQTDFSGAQLAGLADFVGAEILSGDFSDTEFAKNVSFHTARLHVIDFQNARFRGKAVFSSANFGSNKPCGQQGNLSANFLRATFDKDLDMTASKIYAPVNFSYIAFDPGRYHVKWDQISGRLVSEDAWLKEDEGCSDLRSFERKIDSPNAMSEENLYLLLEANFRKQDRLSDANHAYFLAQHAKASSTGRIRDYNRTAGTPSFSRRIYAGCCSCLNLSISECFWGYGVAPLRPIGWLCVFWLVFAVVYKIVPKRLVLVDRELRWPRVKLWMLPVTTVGMPAWAGRPRYFSNSFLLALEASAIAFTGVELRRVELRLAPNDWFRVVMIVQRAFGLFLVSLAGVAFGQSVPVLGKVLSFLL